MNEQIMKCPPNGSTSCIYIMGVIGAAIYFISNATGFWVGVLGLLKAFVWPAFLVYHGFNSLGI